MSGIDSPPRGGFTLANPIETQAPATPAPAALSPAFLSSRPDVSVVLPTYNEAENILDLVDAVKRALAPRQTEVVVVDDDSPDGTWRLVAERAAADPTIRLLHRTAERGLTSALQAGIRLAKGNVICWMDCDFSHPPETLPALVEALDRGYDLVVGSRYVGGGRDGRTDTPARVWLSQVITRLSSLILVPNFRDYTSGFVAARRGVLDSIELRGDYGEYFIDLVFRAHRAGFRILEIPYVNAPRRAGESKTESGIVGKGLQYLWVVARLRLEALCRPRRTKFTKLHHPGAAR